MERGGGERLIFDGQQERALPGDNGTNGISPEVVPQSQPLAREIGPAPAIVPGGDKLDSLSSPETPTASFTFEDLSSDVPADQLTDLEDRAFTGMEGS